MGDFYGGQYLETRLGETKKGERLTVYAETHQQGYHVRMAILGYEWRIPTGSYRSEGLVEMRVYGTVTHEGLAPVMVDGEHLLSDAEYQFGVSSAKTLQYLTSAQIAEFIAALARPRDFALTWLLQDHGIGLSDNIPRRMMHMAEAIFLIVDQAVARFMHEHPEWKPPEKPDYRWENR